MKLKSIGNTHKADTHEKSPKSQSSAAVEDVYEMIESTAISAEDVVTVAEGIKPLGFLANNAVIIRFVNLILYLGVVEGAQEIRLWHSDGDCFKIMLLIGDELREVNAPNARVAPALIARLKTLANIGFSPKHIDEQNGIIPLTCKGRSVDVRVSYSKVSNGESVVLRIARH